MVKIVERYIYNTIIEYRISLAFNFLCASIIVQRHMALLYF